MSLSLNAPKGKAKANSLTNGRTVLPEKGRATLESDLSVSGSPSRGKSHRERIMAYLGTHGPSPIKDLVRELGLTTKQVTKVLDRHRDKYFHHYKESHLWGNTSKLFHKCDIKPVSVRAFSQERQGLSNE